MNRRGFLCLLTAVPAALIVPKFFLPPKGGWPLAAGDFDTANLRYKAYERFSEAWTDPRGVFGLAPFKPEGGVILYDGPQGPVGPRCLAGPAGPDLNEASLEQLCIDIKKHVGDRDVILRRPRLFVGSSGL